MRTKSLAVLGSILAAVMFLGGALLPMRADRSQAGSTTPAIVLDAAALGASRSGASSIEALLARIQDGPDDAQVNAQLGILYVQEALSQAAPSYLPLAHEALQRSLELQSEDNLEAFIGMALLTNARHDFAASIRWARRAIEADPFHAGGYGLLGDALFEMGSVRSADAAYQQMVDVRPTVASYVRASYAHGYHGRTEAALTAMQLAIQAAGPSGEIAAWVRHQMGDIHAGLGNHREAARQNRIGIAIAPGYVPPTVGLAEAYIALGRTEDALAIMESAAADLPTLEYMTTLADLYSVTGRDEDAARGYGLVAEKLKNYRSHGVLPDADFILFYADHGLRPMAALREAELIYRNRPTAKTADALAWILHAVGRDREAWGYATEAMTSSGGDAGVLFHAGVIAEALGHDERAGALMRETLELDPTFSLVQLPIARRIAGIR